MNSPAADPNSDRARLLARLLWLARRGTLELDLIARAAVHAAAEQEWSDGELRGLFNLLSQEDAELEAWLLHKTAAPQDPALLDIARRVHKIAEDMRKK